MDAVARPASGRTPPPRLATPPQSNTAAFALNVLWSWLGVAVAVVGGFVLSPYMMTTFGVEGYGVWALVFSLVDYYGMLDLGFRSATVKYCAHYRALAEPDKVNEVINTSLLYFLLVACAVLALTLGAAPFLDRFFILAPAHVKTFRTLLLLVGCSFALQIAASAFQAGLEGFGRFDVIARTTILTTAVRIALSFALLAAGGGPVALGAFVVGTQIAAQAMNAFQFRRVFAGLRLSPQLMKISVLRQLARYGIHTVTAGAGTQLINQTPPLLIGHFCSAAAVGFYNVPVRLMQSSGVEISSRVGLVSASRAAELCAQGDLPRVGFLGIYTNRYCLSLFMPLAIFLTLFGRSFLTVWIGPAWALAAGPLLLPFVIGTAFAVCAQFNTSAILYGLGEHRIFARGLFAEGVAGAAALLIAVPRFGIEGAAWSSAALMVLNRGLFLPWILCRSIAWRWRDYLSAILVRPLLAAIPVAVAATLARNRFLPGRNWLELVAAGMAISAGYGLIAFFCCVEREHRRLAWRGVARALRLRAGAT